MAGDIFGQWLHFFKLNVGNRNLYPITTPDFTIDDGHGITFTATSGAIVA